MKKNMVIIGVLLYFGIAFIGLISFGMEWYTFANIVFTIWALYTLFAFYKFIKLIWKR